MEFLTMSIHNVDNGKWEGALLTSFDPNDLTSRATVSYWRLGQLLTREGYDPSGFRVTDDGLLMSDTQAYRAMDAPVVENMYTRDKIYKSHCDITDLVLLGASEDCSVIANYSQLLDGEEEALIHVPFKSMKVSSSSFNIYSPYQNEDGAFRTISLLDPRNGAQKTFYAELTDNVVERLKSPNIKLKKLSSAGNKSCYEVNASLQGCEVSVGEAFCNYLAYNVAYYSIGLAIMDMLTTPTKYVPVALEQTPRKPSVKPEVNVEIKHSYNMVRVTEVMSVVNDPEGLKTLLKDYLEASITLDWLTKIFSSPWSNDDSIPEEDQIAVACTNMRPACKANLLHFNIELLSHRYCIYRRGIFDDITGVVLKGGGVSGTAIKRITG